MENNRRRKQKQTALVFCQGGKRAKYKISPDGITGDCRQVMSDHPEGLLDCAWGCIGRGSCVSACKFNAIRLNTYGTAEIDPQLCIGCGLCMKVCPKDLIHMVKPENTIMPRCSNKNTAASARTDCSVSCIACRICEKNCPADAISVVENCAVIDQNVCIACGMCAIKCPRHVIVDADGIFTVNG